MLEYTPHTWPANVFDGLDSRVRALPLDADTFQERSEAAQQSRKAYELCLAALGRYGHAGYAKTAHADVQQYPLTTGFMAVGSRLITSYQGGRESICVPALRISVPNSPATLRTPIPLRTVRHGQQGRVAAETVKHKLRTSIGGVMIEGRLLATRRADLASSNLSIWGERVRETRVRRSSIVRPDNAAYPHNSLTTPAVDMWSIPLSDLDAHPGMPSRQLHVWPDLANRDVAGMEYHVPTLNRMIGLLDWLFALNISVQDMGNGVNHPIPANPL